MSFYLSKILWLIINPFNIILFLIFIGCIFHLYYRSFIHRILYFLALLIFIITAILPTGKFMMYQLEKNFHTQIILPKQIDGIVILAGATNPELSSEHENINLNGAVERLTESIQLIHKYSSAKIVFSGGSGSIYNQDFSHAKVAREFFQYLGVDTSKIIFESKSRNTYESILFSRKIAKPLPNENWLLVTSGWHMNRSINIGKKLEWEFIPYAVDFHSLKKISWMPSFNFLSNMGKFQSASHEWVGLVAYYLMGRTSKIY